MTKPALVPDTKDKDATAPVVVKMSDGQVFAFRSFDRDEKDANAVLARVQVQRNAAAMAVVLATYSAPQLNGCPMSIDTDAQTITFTPNVPPK